MSPRAAWATMLVLVAGLAAAALRTDLAGESGGRFWGDGATYYTMAWSLAEDGDLRYEARDPVRVRREFAGGAQGIFLKRSFGGLAFDPAAGFPWLRRIEDADKRIYFAKPFTYAVIAAPLVKLFGTRGLLLTNALGLGVALLLSFVELRRRAAPGTAAAAAAVLILATVAPAYLFWTTPEALSVGMAALGLALWRGGWPLASAVVLGIATYSKPPNLFLAIPLGVMPLLESAQPWRRRLLDSGRRGAAMAATVLACYLATMAVTGEWNYQGGRERKTFYGVLPFEDQKTTFGNSGIWMGTDQVGPSVEGEEKPPTRGAEPGRSAAELSVSFLHNLGYFWIGRFGGVVPYFFPAAVAVLLFLGLGPREPAGWLCLLSLVVSWLFYIWMIPDNWYGGSGTLGNRYFLNLLPLALFLIPRGRERFFALAGSGGLLFVLPILVAPVSHALDPGDHARRGAFRYLPAELSMLNDLAVFGEPWRKKRQVGDVDRDPAAYYLYFPDDGAFGREEKDDETGFWVRGGAEAEVFVRALEPVKRLTLRVTGAGRGDTVAVRVGGESRTLELGPNETREAAFEPPRGFPYKETFVTVIRLRSTRSSRSPRGDDTRELGAFVSIRLEVERRTPKS